MTDQEMDVDELAGNGILMDEIRRHLGEWELKNFPEVSHSADHTVLFNLPLSSDPSIPPKPYRTYQKWDSYHVRLPCSAKSQYPVSNPDGTEDIKERWTLITNALTQEILTTKELEAAILSYNAKYSKTWRFRALHKIFHEMSDEGQIYFFQITLPGIIRMALKLPELIPGAVPLLKCGTNRAVSFSQEQIGSLLANAFLCTYPRRNTQKKNSEYRTFPDINFNRLFQSTEPQVLEKIKCILNYFRRICKHVPTGVITIMRRCKPSSQMPDWPKCGANFKHSMLHVTHDGTIEDQGTGMLQVDFANKYLGGGVLGHGCVQEEIRFVICPELFVTKLIAEVLQPNEALFMVGCEQYSAYTGYASSFAFDGEYIDDTPWDDSRRRMCAIVAIDALNFHTSSDQYREDLMKRELDKAFVGYNPWLSTPAPAVATGNWGCGAFGGDKRLKALLQLMVCAATCRPLVYFTFGDKELKREFLEVYYFLRDKSITVGQLWSFLKRFRQQKISAEQLYPYLYQSHRDSLGAIRVTPEPTESKTEMPSSSFTWPHARSKSPKLSSDTFYNKSSAGHFDNTAKRISFGSKKVDTTATTSSTSPQQPKTSLVGGSLLQSLDDDYARDSVSSSKLRLATVIDEVNDTISNPAAVPDSVDEVDVEQLLHDLPSNDEVVVEIECDDIAADRSFDTTTQSLLEHSPSKEASTVAANVVDDDEDTILGTPSPPIVPRRTKLGISHGRQKKISDFLVRK